MDLDVNNTHVEWEKLLKDIIRGLFLPSWGRPETPEAQGLIGILSLLFLCADFFILFIPLLFSSAQSFGLGFWLIAMLIFGGVSYHFIALLSRIFDGKTR